MEDPQRRKLSHTWVRPKSNKTVLRRVVVIRPVLFGRVDWCEPGTGAEGVVTGRGEGSGSGETLPYTKDQSRTSSGR